MGKLTPQNRALQESLSIAFKLVNQNRNQSHGSYGDLTRAENCIRNALDILNKPAARSEAQPSGYDGSKSLGERLYEAIYGEFGPIPWNYLLAHEHALWDHAALTFTASLSDASEVEEEIGPPTPLGALKFRMEQGAHSQSDFAKLIGNRSHASEILAGKRSLSKAMIATLADEWGIPARSLLGPGITASLSDASPKPAEGDA